ncbi:MAG: phosphoribosylformylglycinamidine synthase, partial [Elusimicrobiota bacterium]
MVTNKVVNKKKKVVPKKPVVKIEPKVLVEDIDVLKANDKQLVEISNKNLLALTLAEMKVVQQYFRGKQRNPTDIELETIAQTWSEHCKHKTLTGVVEYQYYEKGKLKKKVFDNLLKSTIARATKELDRSWCISVFKDNAGIIEFNK